MLNFNWTELNCSCQIINLSLCVNQFVSAGLIFCTSYLSFILIIACQIYLFTNSFIFSIIIWLINIFHKLCFNYSCQMYQFITSDFIFFKQLSAWLIFCTSQFRFYWSCQIYQFVSLCIFSIIIICLFNILHTLV
jgi:hypothetical protein